MRLRQLKLSCGQVIPETAWKCSQPRIIRGFLEAQQGRKSCAAIALLLALVRKFRLPIGFTL